MQGNSQIKRTARKIDGIIPLFGHALPLFVVSAAFIGITYWAVDISGLNGRQYLKSWELLGLSVALGAIGFSALVSWVSLENLRIAKAERERAKRDVNSIRQELSLAQSMLKAEPQMLMLWDEKGEPNLVIHTLDTDTGIPFHFSETLYFDSWLENSSAQELRDSLETLFQDGSAFTLKLRTLTGHHLEADGRAASGMPILRLRNIAASAIEIANIYEDRRRLARLVETQKSLLNALPLPVWFKDEAGKIKWVNTAYSQAVEASGTDDVCARQIELLEMRQRKDVAEKIAEGETFSGRFHTITGGEHRTFDTLALPLSEGSAGLAIDVGAIETAEGQVENLIEAHSRTLNRVATAIAIFDSRQKLTFYNQAYVNLWSLDISWLETGPSEGELLDQLRTMRQLPEEADYRAWRQKQIEVNQEAEPHEDWWHLPDGRSIHVMREQRTDGGATHLYDDVTERFAMESRYNELIGVQRETLDNLAEGVAVFSTDGRLRLYNPGFSEIWQLEEKFLRSTPHIDEVIYQCRSIFDDASWGDVHSAVTSISDQREPIGAELTRPDGRIIHYSAAPLPDGATLLTYRDVTAMRRMERVLRERNEALVASDRLKNTFISHVSYELRSPLTNIIGFSELLSSNMIGDLNEKQSEYLTDIRSSSDNLLAIVDDILDLATIDAGGFELNMETVSVKEVIEQATEKLHNRFDGDEINIDLNIAKNIGQFEVDQKRINQVLFNLLSNAVGFSDQGATVNIAAKRDKETIQISIIDQGCGIPEAEQVTVFDRFESNTRGSNHRGAGLGLALVKSLVSLHGGSVELTSEPSVGTTVTVHLPISQQNRMSDQSKLDEQKTHAA